MTPEQYSAKLKLLQLIHTDNLNELSIEYAMSNNTIAVDDVITDHMGSIKVVDINVGTEFMGKYPICIYRGVEVKKDGTPKKKANVRDVWQNNIVIVQ